MVPENYPLLKLFSRLREAGLPLGISEYQLALQALQAGYGLQGQAALARVCATLWVKSLEEQTLFDYHFEQVMAEDAEALVAADTPPEVVVLSWWQRPRNRYMAMGGALLLLTGLGIFGYYAKRQAEVCPRFASSPETKAVVDEEYLYDISVASCSNSQAPPAITVDEKPDWLEFTDLGDGNALLSGTPPAPETSVVNIWNLKGEVLFEQGYEGERRQPLVFSPDGQKFITIDADNSIYLWALGAETKQPLLQLPNGERPSQVVFSPSGNYIAALTYTDADSDSENSLDTTKLKIWNLRGEIVKEKEFEYYILRLTFSPNDQNVILTDGTGTVSLIETTGQDIRPIDGSHPVANAEFTPDGRQVVTVTGNDDVSLVDLNNGQSKALANSGLVQDVRLSQNNNRMAILSGDTYIRVFDKTGNQISAIQAPERLYSIDIDPEGSYIVAKSDESNNLFYWNWERGNFSNLSSLLPSQSQYWLDSYYTNIIFGSKNYFFLTNYGTNLVINPEKNFYSDIGYSDYYFNFEDQPLVLSPDRNRFFKVDANGKPQIRTLDNIPIPNSQLPDKILGFRISNDNSRIITRSVTQPKLLQVWDWQGKTLGEMPDIDNSIDNTISPNSDYFVTLFKSNEFKLWDRNINPVATIPKPEDFRNLEYSLSGQEIVIWHGREFAQLWTFKGRMLAKLSDLNNETGIRFSSDKRHFITRSQKNPNLIRAWNNDGELIREVNIPGDISSIEFSSAGNKAIIYSGTDTLYVWDWSKPQMVHLKDINVAFGVYFMPTQGQTITLGLSGMLQLRDETGNVISELDQKIEPGSIDQFITLADGTVVFGNGIGEAGFAPVFKVTIKEDNSLQNFLEFSGQSLMIDRKKFIFLRVTPNDRLAYWNLNGNLLKEYDLNARVRTRDRYFSSVDEREYENAYRHRQPYDYPQLKATDNQDSFNIFPGNQAVLLNLQDLKLNLFDINQDKLISLLPDTAEDNFLFAQDSNNILAVDAENNARLWNWTGKLLHSDEANGLIVDAALDAKQQKFTLLTEEDSLRAWNFKTRENSTYPLKERVRKVAVSPRGEYLATYFDTGELELWSKTDELVSSWSVGDSIEDIEFSPAGNFLITFSRTDDRGWNDEYRLKVWNLQGKKILETTQQQGYGETISIFDDSDQYIVTRSSDRDGTTFLQIWNSAGEPLFSIDDTYDYAVSNQGQYLATQNTKGILSLWSFSGEKMAEWKTQGHQNLTFSSDSKHLLTYMEKGEKESADGSPSVSHAVYVWDLKGKLLAKIAGQDGGNIWLNKFTADSQHVATVSRDYFVEIESLEGNTLGQVIHFDKIVQDPLVNADGQFVLTITADHTVQLSDIKGKRISSIPPGKDFTSAGFSSSGKYFYTLEGKVVKLWNMQGKLIKELLHPNPVLDLISFSPSAEELLTTTGGKGYLWDAKGNLIREFAFPDKVSSKPDTIESFFFDLTGNYIAFGLSDEDWNRRTVLINIKENKETELTANGKFLSLVNFSPSGDYLLTESNRAADNSVEFQAWNLQGRLQFAFKISDRYWYGIPQFSPNGKFIIIDSGQIFQVWNSDGKLIGEVKNSREDSRSITLITRDEKYLVTAGENKVYIFNIQENKLQKYGSPLIQQGSIADISLGENDTQIRVLLKDGTIAKWDFEGNQISVVDAKTTEQRVERIRGGLRFLPDWENDLLISSFYQDTVHLWDLEGVETARFSSGGDISQTKFSADGQYLAIQMNSSTAQGKGVVQIWAAGDQAQTGKPVATVYHAGQITGVAFSPDNRRIATASSDQTAAVWNLKGKRLATCWHQGRVLGVNFTADGKRLMTASDDGLLSVWDLECNRLETFSDPERINNPAWYEYSGNAYNEILNPENGQLIEQDWLLTVDRSRTARKITFAGEELPITPVTIDPNARVGLSHNGAFGIAQQEGAIELFSVETGQRQPLDSQGEVIQLQESPNGEYLATLSSGNLDKVRLSAVDESGSVSASQEFTIRTAASPIKTITAPKDVDFTYPLAGVFLGLGLLSGGYGLARWLGVRRQQQQAEEMANNPQSDASLAKQGISGGGDMLHGLEDETQVVKAVRQGRGVELGTAQFSPVDTAGYLPVSRRQMKQSWRYLRRSIREGPPTELDMEATVRSIGRQGVLMTPVMQPRRVNRTELLLLIDRDGSMVPFHLLSERIIETAVQGGRLGKANIYYFHNSPDDYLYDDPHLQQAELLKTVLQGVSEYTGVMIFSDAGAARGGLNLDRMQLTHNFINTLRQQVRYVAWLNPMPRSRWFGTTAGEIAGVVPMFELHRQGLQDAISVLRGKVIHNPI